MFGITPNMTISFVSSAYPGSISDKELVSKSGVLSQTKPGDMILCDRGFTIQEMCPTGIP